MPSASDRSPLLTQVVELHLPMQLDGSGAQRCYCDPSIAERCCRLTNEIGALCAIRVNLAEGEAKEVGTRFGGGTTSVTQATNLKMTSQKIENAGSLMVLQVCS